MVEQCQRAAVIVIAFTEAHVALGLSVNIKIEVIGDANLGLGREQLRVAVRVRIPRDLAIEECAGLLSIIAKAQDRRLPTILEREGPRLFIISADFLLRLTWLGNGYLEILKRSCFFECCNCVLVLLRGRCGIGNIISHRT